MLLLCSEAHQELPLIFMAQDHLVGLAILSIEKDISNNLSLDKVVD